MPRTKAEIEADQIMMRFRKDAKAIEAILNDKKFKKSFKKSMSSY